VDNSFHYIDGAATGISGSVVQPDTVFIRYSAGNVNRWQAGVWTLYLVGTGAATDDISTGYDGNGRASVFIHYTTNNIVDYWTQNSGLVRIDSNVLSMSASQATSPNAESGANDTVLVKDVNEVVWEHQGLQSSSGWTQLPVTATSNSLISAGMKVLVVGGTAEAVATCFVSWANNIAGLTELRPTATGGWATVQYESQGGYFQWLAACQTEVNCVFVSQSLTKAIVRWDLVFYTATPYFYFVDSDIYPPP
jgi:hypothetical protein